MLKFSLGFLGGLFLAFLYFYIMRPFDFNIFVPTPPSVRKLVSVWHSDYNILVFDVLDEVNLSVLSDISHHVYDFVINRFSGRVYLLVRVESPLCIVTLGGGLVIDVFNMRFDTLLLHVRDSFIRINLNSFYMLDPPFSLKITIYEIK